MGKHGEERGMRVSDRMRERTTNRLTRGCAEGYLSVDTLSVRVDAAFSARRDSELDRLVADVPKLPWRLDEVRRFVGRTARRAREWLYGPPRLPPPPLTTEGEHMLIGRAESCNLVIESPTVSRRHAELRLHDGRWLLSDLGSTNGTWVNGWHVEQAVLESGDVIGFGEFSATFG